MELSDEDVAKLLAKDIDKHKSKAVPVDAAIKDHFFRGSTAVILYRFGRGAFAIQKWYPWYPLFNPVLSSSRQRIAWAPHADCLVESALGTRRALQKDVCCSRSLVGLMSRS